MLPSQIETHFQGAGVGDAESVKNSTENVKERYLTQATG